MKTINQYHLDEEQISRAVVDESDLSGENRLHLSECLTCREEVKRIRQELSTLGEFARLAVPPMEKTVVLPAPEEPVSAGHGSGWLPSFGAAVMAGLVLFVYFLGIETTPLRIPQEVSLEEQSIEITLEDEDLMDEILEMVEYPLPDVIYEITGDNGEYFDEFMEFVVPEDQEDFQS